MTAPKMSSVFMTVAAGALLTDEPPKIESMSSSAGALSALTAADLAAGTENASWKDATDA